MADTFSFGDGNQIPALLISAGDLNNAVLVAPALTLLAGAIGTPGALPLPALTVGTSNTGNLLGYSILTLPTLTNAGGVDGGATLIVPALTLTGLGGTGGALVFPVLIGAGPDADGSLGDVITGGVASIALLLPALVGNSQDSFGRTDSGQIGAGISGSVATAGPLPFPALITITSANNASIITAANSLPPLILTASALSGNVGTASLALPAALLTASGYPNGVLSFSQTFPPLLIVSQGASVLPATYQTWVLNMRKTALTEYTNFNFNSYAEFNGQFLGCGPTGVFVLDQSASDNGTPIDAVARTGMADYDRSLLKRVPRLYVGYKTDGDMIFRSITSEGGTRSYPLYNNNVIGFTQRRVPIGKGPKSSYWQYEVENVAGADFTLQSILAYPVMLKRRVF